MLANAGTASERSAFAKSKIIPVLKKVEIKIQLEIDVNLSECEEYPIQLISLTESLVRISFKITMNIEIPPLIKICLRPIPEYS